MLQKLSNIWNMPDLRVSRPASDPYRLVTDATVESFAKLTVID